jgi:hypothetical protein
MSKTSVLIGLMIVRSGQSERASCWNNGVSNNKADST